MVGETVSIRGRRYSRTTVFLVILIACYLATRLLFLLRLPPVIDEGTHIYLAWEMQDGDLASGAGDGRWTTIQIFALALLLPLKPLLAVRLVGVISGLFTMLAIFFTGRRLFSEDVGFISSLLYVLVPYALFYDRLALSDGLSLAFGTWTLFLSIRCVQSERRYDAFLLTVLLLLTILTKLAGILAIFYPIGAVIFLAPRDRWLRSLRKSGPAVLSAIIVTVTLWLRSAGADRFFDKTSQSSLVSVDLLLENVGKAFEWYWPFLTPPLTVLALFSIFWLLIKKRTPEVLYLLSVLLVTLLPNLIFFETWYPRYLLFTLIPIFLIISAFLYTLFQRLMAMNEAKPLKYALVSLVILGLAYLVYLDSVLISKPQEAKMAAINRAQYIEKMGSGYSVSETAEFLENQASISEEGIDIIRFFNWDQAYQGLNIFLYPEGPSENRGDLRSIEEMERNDLVQQGDRWLLKRPTYIVFDRANIQAVTMMESLLPRIDAERVLGTTKPGGFPGLEVWKVNSPSATLVESLFEPDEIPVR